MFALFRFGHSSGDPSRPSPPGPPGHSLYKEENQAGDYKEFTVLIGEAAGSTRRQPAGRFVAAGIPTGPKCAERSVFRWRSRVPGDQGASQTQRKEAATKAEAPNKPQRRGAAEPQPKSEHPMNRRDATSAEKSKRTKILLKMRESPLLHCDERRSAKPSVFSASIGPLRLKRSVATLCDLLVWCLRIAYTLARQSGRGLPHSKTLTRGPVRQKTRRVLECGCPLPLSAPREI